MAQLRTPTPPTELNWSLRYSAVGPLMRGRGKQHKQKPHAVRMSTVVLNYSSTHHQKLFSKGFFEVPACSWATNCQRRGLQSWSMGYHVFESPLWGEKRGIAYLFRGRLCLFHVPHNFYCLWRQFFLWLTSDVIIYKHFFSPLKLRVNTNTNK